MTGRLADRIALVTGASRGIGRAVALELAREGAHVVAVARTTGALEELDDEIRTAGGIATLVPLDLRDGAAFPRLAGAIAERWKKLDILVGNAGVLGTLTPVTNINPKHWIEALDVNVNANLRLIQFLDPLLKASDAGRAVFVTSGAAQNTRAYWGIYSATKAALDALIKTYAAECATTKVRVNLFSPGPVRTAMRAKAMPGEDATKLRTPEDIAPQIVELCLAAETRNGEIIAARHNA
ncbi:MAG: SDR family NAD(P)-dependent oxidoreductase [Alphaproteobacteria bacterium]|nr:SDR family NAD(P)-dependent oxidoreductase [Alphaproteobacteria bacterium]